MKVEVNRNDEMPKAGDLVIDELGNIGILMHNGYIWLLKHPGTVKFPELNKGERIEMNLQFEFGIK